MSDKSSSEFGKIKVNGERLLVIKDDLGWDKVREMANAHKVKAMGMVQQFLFKAKEEDITITYEEKRYQAFWYVEGTSYFDYKRKVKYKVPVEKVVEDVTIQDKNLKVNKSDNCFELAAIEHCNEHYHEELMVDAQSDQPGDFSRYLKYPVREISSTDDLEGHVVNIETKASYFVRKVINELVKPIKADEVLEEKIVIEELSLIFYPVYTFEYSMVNKDKKVMVEIDGVTSEFRKGRKLTDKLMDSFTSDELFDFAKEVANFIPGGSLAMLAGKKALELATKK